jgi:hypothetical protein
MTVERNIAMFLLSLFICLTYNGGKAFNQRSSKVQRKLDKFYKDYNITPKY